VLAKNGGGRARGRSENPRPWRLSPATAAPVVMASWASGTMRASIRSRMPSALMTPAMIPQGAKRSTVTVSLVALPLHSAAS